MKTVGAGGLQRFINPVHTGFWRLLVDAKTPVFEMPEGQIKPVDGMIDGVWQPLVQFTRPSNRLLQR